MSTTHFKIDIPRSLASQVASGLRDAIIDGEFALGEMIAEESLAARFGVSRTPVREAINQLQLQGLVIVKPQRGSYVFEPSEDDIHAICEFRCVVEPHAAELAWRHDRAATAAALHSAITAMEQARTQRDAVQYGRADTRLHQALFDHCGNPYMQAAYASAAPKIATLRTHLSAPADVLHSRGFEQHFGLLEQFKAGDFAGFKALMQAHVTSSRDNYIKMLRMRRS